MFCRLDFHRFEKREREFSSLDPAGDLSGTYGPFNMPQRIKMASKFERQHVSPLLHPPDSPDIRHCDFWLFGMLNGVLKDRKINSSDEIEKVITKIWDELTFDEVQSVVHNWMSHLAWVIENGGE
jgi:hypothetical protein